MAVIILGGMGSIPGAILGGLAFGLSEVLTVAITRYLQPAGRRSLRGSLRHSSDPPIRAAGPRENAGGLKARWSYLLQFYAIYGSVINFIGINALLALSLNVTLAAGMLSLGNAAFAGLGGYTAGILSLHFKLPYASLSRAGPAPPGLWP